MPTYEYECTKCDHVFERFQSMTDEPVKRCPKCKCKVRRLFGTGAGIIFKGSGFYETDYRSKNYRDGESKAKSAASSSTASSGSKAKKSAKKTPAEASK
ncbi:MAG: zinc ribbon domain-containing protein [Verrucomicrobia bacterium]|jgi:putative FmdB family regulatory protein|nr:zinc ribbon domain-containing protein [Verrucomicrobiota bacterium]